MIYVKDDSRHTSLIRDNFEYSDKVKTKLNNRLIEDSANPSNRLVAKNFFIRVEEECSSVTVNSVVF